MKLGKENMTIFVWPRFHKNFLNFAYFSVVEHTRNLLIFILHTSSFISVYANEVIIFITLNWIHIRSVDENENRAKNITKNMFESVIEVNTDYIYLTISLKNHQKFYQKPYLGTLWLTSPFALKDKLKIERIYADWVKWNEFVKLIFLHSDYRHST